MLSLDKPFVPGQRIKVKGYEGTLEEVGLRSVKIRALTGHQVSIPNEDVARIDIENIGRRPYIRRLFNVTITYDTPPEKIGRAMEMNSNGLKTTFGKCSPRRPSSAFLTEMIHH